MGRIALGGVALVAFIALGAYAPEWARQRAEVLLSQRLGRPVQIASLAPRWKKVLLRNVRVSGAPPCADEATARIEEMAVAFSSFFHPKPSSVVAEGVDVTVCGDFSADNLPRPPQKAETPALSAPPATIVKRMRIRVAGASLWGRPVELRARGCEIDAREGVLKATVDAVRVELGGAATFEADRTEVVWKRGAGETTVHGNTGRIALPGGGTLITNLDVFARRSATGTTTVHATTSRQGTSGETADRDEKSENDAHLNAAASIEIEVAGANAGSLHIETNGLPLRGMRPWVDPHGVNLSDAKTTLRLNARTTGNGAISFESEGSLDGFSLRHRAIVEQPWTNLSARGQAAGTLVLKDRKLELTRFSVNALGADLAGSAFLQTRPTVHGRISVGTPKDAPLSCGALLAEQPAPVRELLRGLALAGTVGLDAEVVFDAQDWTGLTLQFALSPLCKVNAEPEALVGWLPGAGTKARVLADGTSINAWVPFARMPKHVVDAFLTAEDGRFFAHSGFDLETIRRALAHDLATKTFAKGASTLTQQLAKNLFLSSDRALVRKFVEAVYAWRLEERLGKEKILELYLNIIELGPGIRGVGQAAQESFGKDVSTLSPLEAAHLASLTPNPKGFARRFRDGRIDEGWMQKLEELLTMMNRSGRLSASELASARRETLSLRKRKP